MGGPASVVLGALLVTQLAHADPKPSASDCVGTHESALAHRRQGELTLAAKEFAACTQPSCPAPVREECAARARQIDSVIPTVVPVAKIEDGQELVDVEVEVDGHVLTQRLDGRAHRLDPGPHRFQFHAKDRSSVEIDVVLAEGEQLRRVEAIWKPDSSKASAPIPTAAYVLAGVGVVGLAGFGYFGLRGLSKEHDLSAENCEPRCDQDKTDDLERTYLFADISLAVGLLGLGGATYFYVSSRSTGSPSTGRTTFVSVAGAF